MGGGCGDKASNGVGFGGTYGGCFVEGTLILTEHGHVPIEQVKPGDMVWAEDISTGEKGLKKVLNTYIHTKNTLVNVHCGDILITTTEGHPFWTENEGWVFASELDTGYILRNSEGEQLQVTNVEVIESWQPVNVYNFEVEDWHCYYVSEKTVLVHNNSGMPPAPTNTRKINQSRLKKAVGDVHAFKKHHVGKDNIAKFDAYEDKDTGQIWLIKKQDKRVAIPTGEYIK